MTLGVTIQSMTGGKHGYLRSVPFICSDGSSHPLRTLGPGKSLGLRWRSQGLPGILGVWGAVLMTHQTTAVGRGDVQLQFSVSPAQQYPNKGKVTASKTMVSH